MLAIRQQRHLVYFDEKKQCFSSFLFQVKEKQDQSEKKNKQQANQRDALGSSFSMSGTFTINATLANSLTLGDIIKFPVSFIIQNCFTHKWESEFYDLQIQQPWGTMPKLHKIPLSLETYTALYKNPQEWKVSLVLKPKFTDSKIDERDMVQKILKNDNFVGKLIVSSNFSHVKNGEPFKIPVLAVNSREVSLQAKKVVKIVSVKDDEKVVCSGQLVETQTVQRVDNFILKPKSKLSPPPQTQFYLHTFIVPPRVNTEHICLMKAPLNQQTFEFNKITITLLSPQTPQFIPTLAKLLQHIRLVLEPQSLTIVQHVATTFESFHGVVFYTDLVSLPQRVFRSYLFDKIEDKWLIEGMASYNRSNKMFQDCILELVDMMTEGEEVVPLSNDTYWFDDVWKTKAKFFFYVLANFKATRDYGSSTLVGLILDFAKKRKITSTYLFRRLKKKYGLDGSFRSTYQDQFIKSTGLNRIFYQLIDIRRDNSVKFIIRQKSLQNRVFKTYNLFRIKLEQAFDEVSPLMQRIMKKNKYDEMSNKRKDLPGPLAVPESIKCLPYFRGRMSVESDACEPFELEMLEQNLIEKTKLSSSLRARPVNRKPGEVDKGIDGFTWMMIDTAYVFPAVYKNQNVHENVILDRIRKVYESQQEEIKVLNCISSTNHAQNQDICKALLQKLKMQPKALNTTLSVKRKILQIIPMFINKLKDSTIWQDYLALFKLYQPPCYDYSEDGFHFLTSLIESCAGLVYRKEFAYYFGEIHRILLAILLNHHQQFTSEEKEIKLKNLLFKALMKWKSKFSFEVLRQVLDNLEVMAIDVTSNLVSLKVILQNILTFLDQVQPNAFSKKQLIQTIRSTITKCIQLDFTAQLYAIHFHYQLKKQQQTLPSIDFLRFAFKQLQALEQQFQAGRNKQRYWQCLKSFKNVLQSNKMKYGLKIQLDQLNEDQNMFLAEYLWVKLASPLALMDQKVRLQWFKIYRVFYFYFTPIITIYKLRKSLKNGQSQWQFSMSQNQAQQLLTNCAQMSFIPDIRWISGYDSSAAKQQKAKYQQYNLENNRRKRKYEELSFSENNIITRYIKENPGKDSWEDIAREALRIIILIEEKKEVDNPEQADRFKRIVEGLKNVQNNLKRGNMPNDYSLDKVKIQSQMVLRQHQEDTQKLQQIFVMVQGAVESIRQQRRQKQLEKQNEMKIFLPKDWLAEEDDGGMEGNNRSLQEIKEHPQEDVEEDNVIRKIMEEEKMRDGKYQDDELQVQRYQSIFDQ